MQDHRKGDTAHHRTQKKKAALKKEMERIQESMDYIDWKQGFYEDVLAGKTEYFSYLIDTKKEWEA